jgi:hypothetical protein
VNKTGHWKDPDLIETYFSKDHRIKDNGKIEALAMFDDGRFLVDGSMERGCKPLLTIQFMPSSKRKEMLWDVKSPENDRLVDKSGNL